MKQNKAPNLWEVVIPAVCTVISLVAGILDLQIPVSQRTKWIIFGVFAGITVLFLIHYTVRKKTAEEKGAVAKSLHSKTLPIDSNVFEYLKTFQNRTWYNKVHILDAKLSISLSRSSESSRLNGEDLIAQEIHWTLVGTNNQMEPLREFAIAVTLSAFTSWENGTVIPRATLQVGNGAAQTVDFHCERAEGCEDIRYLVFSFPANVNCIYAERFTLELTMTWKRGCYFEDVEQYFADPSNYGEKVDSLILEVQAHSEALAKRAYGLYRVNKNTPTAVPESGAQMQKAQIRNTQIYSWTIPHPEMSALYLVEITKA